MDTLVEFAQLLIVLFGMLCVGLLVTVLVWTWIGYDPKRHELEDRRDEIVNAQISRTEQLVSLAMQWRQGDESIREKYLSLKKQDLLLKEAEIEELANLTLKLG